VTAVLDQILEHISRPAGVPCAWVLYVHPETKSAWAPQPEIPWRKILLRQHSEDPMVWGLPGGPIFDGETPEAAAQRWAEAQAGMSCGVFSQSFDVGNDRVFVAPVLGRTPLELLKACNAETFWIGHTVVSDFPAEVIHSAARAACERTDDLILQPTEEPTMSSQSDFTAAQVKANKVAQAYGDAAPSPMTGERLLDYRARLATQYKRFSKAFQNADLHKIGDASAMSGIEDAIYLDALAEARHPTAASLAPGQLRAITTMDASNRPITRYHGDISAFMDQFNPPHRYITRFNTSGRS
jgi:8-oxo-dGTP pyrophosphatase MutT (NUDIX family)